MLSLTKCCRNSRKLYIERLYNDVYNPLTNEVVLSDTYVNILLLFLRPRPHVYVFIAFSYCFRPLFSTPLRTENNIKTLGKRIRVDVA